MQDQQQKINPPKLALKFLRWFCSSDLIEDVEGDLLELFDERSSISYAHAKRRFILDVILLFRPGIIKNISYYSTSATMFQNHLITALRHIFRYKGYTTINLLGLVVGLASSILILTWVRDEIKMDTLHEKEVYKVWRNMYQSNGEIQTTEAIPQPLVEVLNNEYPQIDKVSTISAQTEILFRNGDETSFESGVYASADFFNIFNFNIIAGNGKNPLDDMYSLVLSKSMAERYFGDVKSAIGKTLMVNEQKQEFVVTAVVEDKNTNSAIKFDWMIPVEEYISRNDWIESWDNGGFYIYFSLKDGADISEVNARIQQEINKHTNTEVDERLITQSIKDTYLYSEFKNGVPVSGRIRYIKILSGIAIFLLVMACINFMNLATARSSRRAKEVGVRKVLGAQKELISQQFFVESFLLTFISVGLALVIVSLVLPYFNQLTNKELSLSLTDPEVLLSLAGITFIVGFLSGSYPAILLPTFGITDSLKGMIRGSKFNQTLRNTLVVFQFAMAIMLIIGTFVVMSQIDYILNKNLGLKKDNLLYFNMSEDYTGKEDAYRNKLMKFPQIKDVTFTSGNPVSYGRSTSSASWEGKSPDDMLEINVMITDAHFFSAMGTEMKEGRGFVEGRQTDKSTFVINEVAAKLIGFENPLDQKLSVWGIDGTIIGVVKDFHMNSLYEPIKPLIISNLPEYTNTAFIRIEGDLQEALYQIEKTSKEISPSYPFRYKFLDQEYAESYSNEIIIGTMIRIFAFIAIFISCLGLFGLSSYSADQRSKEIGIRKINGANTWGIVYLLSKNYSKLIIIAFVLASPIAYYFAKEWLENFTFHVDINYFIFFAAGMIAFLIGALTVSIKSYQAASVNPIKTLKSE